MCHFDCLFTGDRVLLYPAADTVNARLRVSLNCREQAVEVGRDLLTVPIGLLELLTKVAATVARVESGVVHVGLHQELQSAYRVRSICGVVGAAVMITSR